jgi:hypothetical protein
LMPPPVKAVPFAVSVVGAPFNMLPLKAKASRATARPPR